MKKSFLSDAMNEMEYGSGHQAKHNKSSIKDGIVSITKIYPSHLVNKVKVNEKGEQKVKNKNAEQNVKIDDGVQNVGEVQNGNKNTQDDESPTISSGSETANEVTEVVTNDSESSRSKEDVNTAISLLRSFVKKLLKQNSTKTASPSTNQTAKHDHELKSDAKSHNKVGTQRGTHANPSTVVSGVKYNLAPVYQFKAKEEKQERLKELLEEEETLRQTLQAKEHEIKTLQQEQDINNNNLSKDNKTTEQEQSENGAKNDTKSVPKDDSAGLQAAQNETNEAQFKFATLKGIPPELLVKLKNILDARKKKKKENTVPTQQSTSRKAFETAKKLVKAAFAREQLYKAEQDFYAKVKEMMNKTADVSARVENVNSSEVVEQGSAEGDFAHVSKYIETLEAEQKNLDPVERRTQPAVNTSNNSTTQEPMAKASSPLLSSKSSSPQTNAASSLPLNTASSQNILNQLNRTKGADEKNVEAAAHLEEKVAEQQDEMYEDLIRHTLNKGRGYGEEEDQDDDDEEAEARDTYNRPPEDGSRLPQENYGDFQDSDEQAHMRSEVMNSHPRKSEKLHFIDENAIYSLKKDRISRPLIKN